MTSSVKDVSDLVCFERWQWTCHRCISYSSHRHWFIHDRGGGAGGAWEAEPPTFTSGG